LPCIFILLFGCNPIKNETARIEQKNQKTREAIEKARIALAEIEIQLPVKMAFSEICDKKCDRQEDKYFNDQKKYKMKELSKIAQTQLEKEKNKPTQLETMEVLEFSITQDPTICHGKIKITAPNLSFSIWKLDKEVRGFKTSMLRE